jgi:two-component system response regulator FixJ
MSHQRTVYVIDDDPSVRRSLGTKLGAIGAESWPFASGAEFLEIIDHLLPACILLDMEMPCGGGLEVMAELRARGIDWPVICISDGDELTVAVEAMKRGAVDFLQKPLSSGVLARALAPAWTVLERTILRNEEKRVAQERVARLTPREVDISLALLSGQPNKAVAHHFGISVRTVEMHRAHIMAKLGVRSLAEAALLANQAGLNLSPPPSRPVARERPPSVDPRQGRLFGPAQAGAPLRQLSRSAM